MKGIKGSNSPGLENVAPGRKGTREQVGLADPVDQAHLPTLTCYSAWPEPDFESSPGDLKPQEATSHSVGKPPAFI